MARILISFNTDIMSPGKTEHSRDRGVRRTTHQQVMSKIDRRNQARQKQNMNHQQNVKSTSVFSGHDGAPRIVAIVPLSEQVSVDGAIKQLSSEMDASTSETSGFTRVRVDRFKQNIVYVPVQRELLSALDACRVADYVMLIISANEATPDEFGESIIKATEGQGISNVFTMVQGLDRIINPKKRIDVLNSSKQYITRYFPAQEKVNALDSPREVDNIIRSLCTTTPKGVNWREDRSWMLVEDVRWPDAVPDTGSGEVIITGVVRGRGLKADRLVQIGDWGDFQIDKITAAPLPIARKRKANEMFVDADATQEEVIEVATKDQDDLADLAPYEVAMDDIDDVPLSEMSTARRGVLLDDHHYFSDDETHMPVAPTRVPKGTSSYQAAWLLDEMYDSESDLDDEMDLDGGFAMNAPALPQDGLEGLDRAFPDPTETTPSEYPQSEMYNPSPDDEAKDIAAYRSGRKDEANDDLEFPDEIELPPNVLARERLARYRGLKSLKTSHWETNEDRAHEPEDWTRLLQITDYKGTKRQVTRETLVGGVQPGKRVNVHLRNVPLSLRVSYNSKKPLTLFSLLRHEHKRTVVNFTMTLSSDYPEPLKSKEEIMMQCGPRRLIINPIFSQTGNTPNNVHKFQRYLHPGQTAMATFIAPLTWGSVPTLFFKSTPVSLTLIGTGTSQPPSHTRIIAKRIILTGHPYKIHKKLVTIRYMFFNAEDVKWFKALQLWTKRGRSGYIKESLGTHGYFKATFDAKINPQDAVGVSLYKRVFPRGARAFRGDGVWGT